MYPAITDFNVTLILFFSFPLLSSALFVAPKQSFILSYVAFSSIWTHYFVYSAGSLPSFDLMHATRWHHADIQYFQRFLKFWVTSMLLTGDVNAHSFPRASWQRGSASSRRHCQAVESRCSQSPETIFKIRYSKFRVDPYFDYGQVDMTLGLLGKNFSWRFVIAVHCTLWTHLFANFFKNTATLLPSEVSLSRLSITFATTSKLLGPF